LIVPRRLACLAVLGALALAGCETTGEGASLCPDAPQGIPLDPDGCPLYSDAAAVPDYEDQCPGTAPGVPVNSDGCPVDADADADGVAGLEDACPGTPSGAGVDARGCSLSGEPMAIVTNINFDFDRTEVRGDVKHRLSRVIQLLREMPDIDVVVIGYTDDVGSKEYNLELSLRRAESVRDYMVTQGIERQRLSVSGRGMADPFVSNSTPEGRAVNRRGEFVVR
jgi:OOP family OmpA-OmpF porin